MYNATIMKQALWKSWLSLKIEVRQTTHRKSEFNLDLNPAVLKFDASCVQLQCYDTKNILTLLLYVNLLQQFRPVYFKSSDIEPTLFLSRLRYETGTPTAIAS